MQSLSDQLCKLEPRTRSTSSEISTTSSASVMSSAAQPNTVQPAASEGETVCYILNPVSPEVLHYSNQFLFCVINRVEIGQLKHYKSQGVASVLMNLYFDKQQRTRAATASAHEQGPMDNAHGSYGYGSSTAHSSPIKKMVTQGRCD